MSAKTMYSHKQLCDAKNRLDLNFASQFRDGNYGQLIRIIRDGQPHPFMFIASAPGLLLYLALFSLGTEDLPCSHITYTQRKNADAADRIGPGSHAGFLMHFLSSDEIWYLSGSKYQAYLRAYPDCEAIPIDYIRAEGIQLQSSKRNKRCKYKDVYDISAFLQALRDSDARTVCDAV